MHSTHHPRRANPLNVAIRSVVEKLEERTLLSTSVEASVLTITGTDADDSIRVSPRYNNQKIKVSVNNQISFFARTEVSAIRIDALGGNDSVLVSERGHPLEIPVTILGGEGDDGLQGGGGADVIQGGNGNDTLRGGRGDDLLQGDAGDDKLMSSKGKDSLDGGDGDDLNVVTHMDDDVVIEGAGEDKNGVGAAPSFPIQTWTGVPTGYSVRQMRNAYGFGDLDDPLYKNRGKGQTIAIVIAYHHPNAFRDLVAFAREQKTLPNIKNNNLAKYFKKNFKQVWTGQRGSEVGPPFEDEDWTGEAMLDIQWAHAIAPEAKIVLVEAQSNHGGDLIFAVDRAIDTLNRSKGRGGVISMSFGFPFAFEDQQAFETTFSTERARNVSFIAASGDLGGVTSGAPVGPPSVTIVGGTKLYLDPFGNRVTGFVNEDALEDVNYGLVPEGELLDLLDNWDHDIDCFPNADINDDTPIDEQFGISGGEGAWWDGSGGPSPIFNAPLWQQNRLGPLLVDLDGDGIPNRGTPDVSWNAHPGTGVSVFNTFGSGGFSGWATVGGTSAGAPQFAGMIALVNQLRAADNRAPIGNSLNERIYRLGGRGPDAYFNDIDVHGSGLLDFDVACDASPGTGRNDGAFVFPANIGWDYATGWGTPNARSLIPALAQRNEKKLRHFRNAQTVRFTGRINERVFLAATGGIPTGPESLNLALFKGTTTVSGLNTLAMPAFRMNHLQTSPGGFGGGVGGGGGGGQPPRTTLVTIDVIGMDEQDGQPNPPAYDLVDGQLLAPGSPIFLWRDGNHITGKAFWLITVLPADGGLEEADFFYFPIEFRGKVVKNEIHGEFFAIDADSHSSQIRGVFNERGIPVVQGRFDSERE